VKRFATRRRAIEAIRYALLHTRVTWLVASRARDKRLTSRRWVGERIVAARSSVGSLLCDGCVWPSRRPLQQRPADPTHARGVIDLLLWAGVVPDSVRGAFLAFVVWLAVLGLYARRFTPGALPKAHTSILGLATFWTLRLSDRVLKQMNTDPVLVELLAACDALAETTQESLVTAQSLLAAHLSGNAPTPKALEEARDQVDLAAGRLDRFRRLVPQFKVSPSSLTHHYIDVLYNS
jgi:hypothetical protein